MHSPNDLQIILFWDRSLTEWYTYAISFFNKTYFKRKFREKIAMVREKEVIVIKTPSEFVVDTPVGQIKARIKDDGWLPEKEEPGICIDYVHEDGDIPLVAVEYDKKQCQVFANTYGDIYEDHPTSSTLFSVLSRL